MWRSSAGLIIVIAAIIQVTLAFTRPLGGASTRRAVVTYAVERIKPVINIIEEREKIVSKMIEAQAEATRYLTGVSSEATVVGKPIEEMLRKINVPVAEQTSKVLTDFSNFGSTLRSNIDAVQRNLWEDSTLRSFLTPENIGVWVRNPSNDIILLSASLIFLSIVNMLTSGADDAAADIPVDIRTAGPSGGGDQESEEMQYIKGELKRSMDALKQNEIELLSLRSTVDKLKSAPAPAPPASTPALSLPMPGDDGASHLRPLERFLVTQGYFTSGNIPTLTLTTLSSVLGLCSLTKSTESKLEEEIHSLREALRKLETGEGEGKSVTQSYLAQVIAENEELKQRLLKRDEKLWESSPESTDETGKLNTNPPEAGC